MPRRTSHAESGDRVAPRSSEAARISADQPLRPGGDPGEHVGVPVQVLRRGVHHHVRSPLERPAVHRRCDRVVDEHLRPRGVGDLADRRQVGHGQVRVRERLDHHERGALARLAQAVEVGDVEQLAVVAGIHDPMRLPVDLLGRDHPRARRGHDRPSPRSGRPCPRRSNGPLARLRARRSQPPARRSTDFGSAYRDSRGPSRP